MTGNNTSIYRNAAFILAKVEIGDSVTGVAKKADGSEYNYVRKILYMIEKSGYIKTKKTTLEFKGKSNENRGKSRKIIFIDSSIKKKAENLAEIIENSKGTEYKRLQAYKEFADLFID
jgi:DNA-binding transcriptional regulator YhcF (GntR family)